MVAPFVLPLIPIVTAVGRFTAPYLVKKLGKMGANKFAKTYGNEAFTSLNETLANNTTMVNPEAIPMVNPNFKAPGVIAPDAEEMEREAEKIREMTKPVGFPAEPPIKPDIKTGETTPPKIDIVEEFPAEDKPLPKLPGFGEGDKIDIPLITYSKDSPKDLKDLVERSVGQEKGEKAIDKLYDDSIFDGVLDSDQLNRMRQLEMNYTGGLNDLGDAAIPVILENSMLDQYEEYMEDYKDALANAARETLGNEFKAYRLMEKDDALKMIIEGEFPNIKRLQEDEEGNEVYKDLIINMLGEETPLSREAFSFSLSPKEALSFRFLSAGDRRSKKDEDFVLIEMKASPTDIIMRGHESEKDLILRVGGETAGSSFVTPKLFNVYDIKFGEKNQVQLLENKDYKNFVDVSKNKLSNVSAQTEKLVRGIGDNNPPSAIEEPEIKEKDKSGVVVPTSLTTQDFLQPKVLDDMLKIQGGVKGFDEIFKRSAPMPGSTKKKMYNQLSEIIDNKYNLSRFPEGESPETVTEERLKYLQNTSSKRFQAIDYIVSAAYDVIHGPTKGRNLSDTIFVTDDEGLPMAAAKIELKFSGPKVYSQNALTITEAGSIFRNAGDQLFDAIIKRAKDEGKRFVVAEDLTSPEALEALKKRGFKLPTTKALKPFKGRKISRPSGRVAYQKNLVLDLSKEIIKEQTDNLLKKK